MVSDGAGRGARAWGPDAACLRHLQRGRPALGSELRKQLDDFVWTLRVRVS